jgi:hypothetical protein
MRAEGMDDAEIDAGLVRPPDQDGGAYSLINDGNENSGAAPPASNNANVNGFLDRRS